MTSLHPRGDQQPPAHFTGTVFANLVVTPADNLDSVIGKVTFEPGARTHWHAHPAGQVLLVTGGLGYYQEAGHPAKLIREGDVVKIAPGVRHWHGATPQSSFTHIALVPSARPDGTDWQQPVTAEEYAAAAPADGPAPLPVALTAAATQHLAQLWPGLPAELQATDPDLLEAFGNFAFDEVAGYGDLDAKTRVIAVLAATIGSQALFLYTQLLEGALHAGVTPVEIKEVLYQAVPYVGIGKVLDFLRATNHFLTEKGLALPLAARQATTTPETRFDQGYAAQRLVVGPRLDTLRQGAPADLQHVQHYLTANCFGDYFTRAGLDFKTREIVILSLLLALGGTEPQVKSHVQGNVNVGNDRHTLLGVITQLLPYVGYPRTLNALACLNEILPAAPPAG